MDEADRFFLILGAAGLAGIAFSTLFGAAAERAERRRLDLRKGAELPEQHSRRAWESTVRPVALLLAMAGVGLVVFDQRPEVATVFVGLVIGAALRGLIANPRHE